MSEMVWVVIEPDGRRSLAGFAKRTYDFGSQGLTLADRQEPLVVDPVLHADDNDTITELCDDVDLVAPKPATDVVVTGTLRLESARHEQRIGIAAGKNARVLRALGARRVHVTADGRPSFSAPDLFDSLLLSGCNAYGGYDEVAQRELDPRIEPDSVDVFAYPRNAGGRGYFLDVDRRRAHGSWLPQIEDPADALSAERFFVPAPEAWIDAPIPGQLGWVPHTCYPRFVRLMGPLFHHSPPVRPIREAAFEDGTDLPDLGMPPMGRAHPRCLQGAAPGLACERLRGDEMIVLDGLLPDAPKLSLWLPGEVPELSLTPPGLARETPRAVLQTLRVDLDRRTVSLCWCAATRLATQVDKAFVDGTKLDVKWKRR